MPVILTTPEEWDAWMRARGMKQVSYSDPAEHTLRIVASGEREDPPYEMAQSQPSLPL